MTEAELALFERELDRICAAARRMGLDFFPMRFEICPADVLYTFGAYGMPTRFAHWSFGKAFHRMKTQYDYNLSRIYELVINSNPCYAFLLDGNTLLQNKVIAAHVVAHSDFFKNNQLFRNTYRFMLDTMANHAERIRRYEVRYGREAVESFLDAALALQQHVDFHRDLRPPQERPQDEPGPAEPPQTPYDDLFRLDEPEPERAPADPEPAPRRLPAEPTQDLLAFLAEHSPVLEDWQRDVLSMVRDEMLYFWPQLETKIMNEGWASFWHARIMRSLDLPDDEALDFARMHAQVLQPSRLQINPYHVGYKLFESIEKRWNDPGPEERERLDRRGGQGLEKIFEVRETESDASFLRNYLTEELVEDLDLYLYERSGDQWIVVEKDWERVRDHLVHSLTNCGIPVIVVADGDHRRRGELLLRHEMDGRELDVEYLEKTLPYLYRLWGRPVHLETVLEEEEVCFSFDGKEHLRT